MKTSKLLLIGFIVELFVSTASADGFARGVRIEGQVAGVSDGDTLTLLVAGNQSVRVRLAEIDAPEKSQAFGQVSKQSLSDLTYRKTVQITVMDTDRYGRTVGRVFVGTTDVNLVQVQKGMAWAYEQYVTDPKIPKAEKAARAAKLGLWSDAQPTPPWLFRKGPAQKTGLNEPAHVKELQARVDSFINGALAASRP
jgi:endonuclease YncB( thermonuclease family)